MSDSSRTGLSDSSRTGLSDSSRTGLSGSFRTGLSVSFRTGSRGPIRAISLDLDDTLWPIAPVMRGAELAMYRHLSVAFPNLTERYSIEDLRALRDQVWQAQPALQHDFTATRRISLQHAMLPFGASEADIDQTLEVLTAARHEVELYSGALSFLEEFSARLPLIALSNGNAELKRIGLSQYFVAQVGAREFGVAKPNPAIFHHACSLLRLNPEQVLHIGDHPEQDVQGALGAGMRAGWIQNDQEDWSDGLAAPDFQARSLTGLASLLRAELFQG